MSYAGVGLRAVATIIDLVVIFILGYLVALVSGQTTPGGFQLEGAPAFLWFILTIAYYVVMEAQLGGTVGKLVLGLKVVRADGSPVDYRAAVIRTALRVIDGLFLYLVAAILVWRSPRGQRLGDRVADTAVVRKASLPVSSGRAMTGA